MPDVNHDTWDHAGIPGVGGSETFDETAHDAHDHTGIPGVGAAAFAGARVYKAAAQTITTGAVTAVQFDTERFDTDAFHDNATNNTRLTVPASLGGKYLIGACIEWVANATGERMVELVVNGSTTLARARDIASSASTLHSYTLNTVYALAVGDYAECHVYHTRGSNLDITADTNHSPEFWIVRLGA